MISLDGGTNNLLKNEIRKQRDVKLWVDPRKNKHRKALGQMRFNVILLIRPFKTVAYPCKFLNITFNIRRNQIIN